MKIFLFFLFCAVPGVLSLTCPYGWSEYGGLCIKYLGFLSFTDGVTACKQLGGRMYEPRSQGSNDLFLAIANEDKSGAWIGINNNRYESDGTIIVYRQPLYTSGYAFVSGSYWYSAECPDETKQVYCELPSLNTDCGEVATIFIEDSFPIASEADCQDACQSTDGCSFWTYTPPNCGLRFYETRDVAGGGRPDTRAGFPFFAIPTNARVPVGRLEKDVPSAANCQKLCSEDPKCISFTWTNYDYTFGGVNSRACIFNYGKPLRTLTLPITSASINIISGPPCCYEKSACERPATVDVGVSVSTGHVSLRKEDLERLQEKQDAFFRRKITGFDKNASNSTIKDTPTEFLKPEPKKGGNKKRVLINKQSIKDKDENMQKKNSTLAEFYQ